MIARDAGWVQRIAEYIENQASPLFVFGLAHMPRVVQQLKMGGYFVHYMRPDGCWDQYPAIRAFERDLEENGLIAPGRIRKKVFAHKPQNQSPMSKMSAEAFIHKIRHQVFIRKIKAMMQLDD